MILLKRTLALLAILFLLTVSLAAVSNTTGKKMLINCVTVQPSLKAYGFHTSDIPKKPISSAELKICGNEQNAQEVCCSANMEEHIQIKVRDKHNKSIEDALQRLQNIFNVRATRFHAFFNNLLRTSKKNFHEMFKKTYGILYEQNANVFIDLFRELEKYYAKGLVDLDDVMGSFFNTLYQKMFTVLNSQYKFENKYLKCVSHHMSEMHPFGDVPQKLSVQIKRSFIATRAFSQALLIAAEVVKNMQQLKATNECVEALTLMTACPACTGIDDTVLACNDMCENVMRVCLSQHIIIDAEWNQFIEAMDKIADRLLGPFNIEMLVRPINLKISEAIMNFQESSSDVSQRVFAGCGRPVLGRRRRRKRNEISDIIKVDRRKFLNFKIESENFKEEDHSSTIILDKLLKEIKQRIRDCRQFWLYLPYKLCNNGLVVAPSNTNNCWNGTHVDKYIYPLLSNGNSRNFNPVVQKFGPRSLIVKEQISAINSISNRLRSAFNGHDIDWIDAAENWSSGSGSGSENLDTITDDEDDFTESSGNEGTSVSNSKLDSSKWKESKGNYSFSTLPTLLPFLVTTSSQHNVIEGRPGSNVSLNILPSSNSSIASSNTGLAISFHYSSWFKKLLMLFLPIILIIANGYFIEWL